MKEASEEVECDSDPEEAKLSLKMRRREASDDEEGEESEKSEKPSRRIDSDHDSEEQGAPAEYEEEDEGEVEEEEEDDELYEESEGTKDVVEQETSLSVPGDGDGTEGNLAQEEDGEEKKVNEPYAVPKAGAFYMHDDRFGGDGVRGRHKRTSGGRRLWESKDDHKWGHDKFEEFTTEERHYEEDRRASRGRNRGRGRTRGADGGSSRGRRPKAYVNDRDQTNTSNQKIQNNPSKTMKGRGPRRYRPSFNDNIDTLSSLSKQSGQSVDNPSLNSTNKAPVPISNLENDAVTSARQRSRLNYDSPPFYPSSSSSKETTVTHKREMRSGTSSRSVQPSLSGEGSASAQSTAIFRKDVNNSLGLNKLKIDDSIPAAAGKPSSNFQPPGSSLTNTTHSFRGQGRGFNALPVMNYPSHGPNNQDNTVSLPHQLHPPQRHSVQSRGQPFLQATGQLFAQQPGTGSQISSPPKTGQYMDTRESGQLESSSDSNTLKASMGAKGKGSLQGAGRGYGAQVMGAPGNMSSGHSDQNVSATPAFFPVMQFGGQHPGGIGVPAVGMAFPGYVQPQNGSGKSQMTWLPVLAGAAGALGAGALGATYCSPYMALDGAYHPRPSGQISSLHGAPIKENNTNKPNSEREPEERLELTNDDFGQRQKNPRRYTEMKFDQ